MSVIDIVFGALSLWVIFGFFYALVSSVPRERKAAMRQLIIIGPVGWIIFGYFAIRRNRDG